MTRALWLTDIHLNFLAPPEQEDFLADVRSRRPDAVLIGGDIGEAHDIVPLLKRIDAALQTPVYFVLGNHDFYHGAIGQVREAVGRFCHRHARMHYLSVMDKAVELAPGVGLVGHDGWADGRVGDFLRSLVSMNDYRVIAELIGPDKRARWDVLKRLGDEAAAHLQRVLPPALEQFGQMYVLTHVPPLRDACWHDGRLSDDHWAPHFTCQAVGEALLEMADAYPGSKLVVLCGHTHGRGECTPRDNLTILTGGAEYGHPEVQRVFELAGTP